MIRELLQELQRNSILTALMGGSVFASLLYVLKQAVGSVWGFCLWRWTSHVIVHSEDPAFERVSEWLASLRYTHTCRNLRLSSMQGPGDPEDNEDLLTPGAGKHLIWYRRRPILIERLLNKDTANLQSSRRSEDIEISCLGSSIELLRELVQEIREIRKRRYERETDIYTYNWSWRLSGRRKKRQLETLFLAPGQKEDLVRDAERFLASREWYAQRGIPYRRGYLLEGPSGTGKTTLALALAGHLNRPIYALNLGSIGDDKTLISAVQDVPEHAVLLVEDIDAVQLTAPRKAAIEPTPDTIKTAPETQACTLSGLLNVLDGVLARDGRILIMTTNHPDKIDPALIRPGRADRSEHIGLLDKNTAFNMANKFFGSYPRATQFIAFNGLKFPIVPAVLQERLLQAHQDDEMLDRITSTDNATPQKWGSQEPDCA